MCFSLASLSQVRGVGAGGIVSTAFCLLYKLYTLRLTRKQINGLMTHTDSPYIRALGFMYLRYTQPPADLYDWYEEYLQDEEEIDVKAGGGQVRCKLISFVWFPMQFFNLNFLVFFVDNNHRPNALSIFDQT